MIEFMDEIVEAVEQFVEGVGENALIILGILAKIIIIITTPVWILPYMAIREVYGQLKKLNERQDKENAGNND